MNQRAGRAWVACPPFEVGSPLVPDRESVKDDYVEKFRELFSKVRYPEEQINAWWANNKCALNSGNPEQGCLALSSPTEVSLLGQILLPLI